MRRLIPILLALAACDKPATAPPPGPVAPSAPPKAKVTMVEAALKDVEYAVEAVGTIEAAQEISIPAQVSGVIDAVNFKEGDAADPSKVLVEIDLERFRLAAARTKADYDRAAAQADLAKTVYDNRLKLYEEAKKQKKDWITEEQLATWRADHEKAKADLERARVDRELASRDLAKASVRAPIPGVINSRLVSKGEYVKAESPVATILDVHTLYVRFTVTELEAARFKTGQELTFSVRSAPGAGLKAKLFFMSQKADPVTRSVECKAEVLENKETLRTGTFAALRIVTQRQKSIVVPDRAALPTERGFILYVVDGDKAQSRLVKLGLKTSEGVEILEGVKAGEKVVVDGAASLREGAAVEAAPERKP